MKTIADFKRRMTEGTMVATKLYWQKDGEWYLRQEHEPRPVTIIQSNSFAIETIINGVKRDSWCAWPKKDQFTVLDENTVKIEEQDPQRPGNGIKLIYSFV